MQAKITYTFKSMPWRYEGKGAWYFLTLPFDLSNEIRGNLKWQEEGWGRLKVKAKIGNTDWDTAIWYDTKHKSYLLPLKAQIRKAENIEPNKEIQVIIAL